jgi:heme/copper-type cytochrome/quinol oxidase subunit 1
MLNLEREGLLVTMSWFNSTNAKEIGTLYLKNNILLCCVIGGVVFIVKNGLVDYSCFT